MAQNLVIVESAAKAKTIAGYLGKGYSVQSCRGHVRDLPPKDFGVDVENGFRPTYKMMRGSGKIVKKLRQAAKGADRIYLAPDPDREGEAIAWHLKHLLKVPADRIRRVTFNEITRGAVKSAFAHPRRINEDLVDAQQTRRILDRIVGYRLSPLISKTVVRGLSAGRVQSVALRLVVERERERRAFEPEEFWKITARLQRADGPPAFEAELTKIAGEEAKIRDADGAEALVKRLREGDYVVRSVDERVSTSRVYPPFITSTMQRSANSRLHLGAARTMRIAQQLYEGVRIGGEQVGLITYMRTDSTRVSKEALGACRSLIKDRYGDPYLPSKPNFFKSPKGAQAAHEAIRPTDVNRRPDEMARYLDRNQRRLYELIWRRFVASQMKPARFKVRTAEITADDASFEAKGRQMVFDGNLRVLRPARESDDQVLPELTEGGALDLLELVPSQHFTKPPSRYTEASLVRELEKRGIGRPSTYAPTIQTLAKRKYVRLQKRTLIPTDLGMVVTDLLVEHFPREMDYSFTSRMEAALDAVEEGKRDWRGVLEGFYGKFAQALERARKEMKLVHGDAPEVKCEKCGRPMEVKYSRKGGRFLGCTGYPECKNTLDYPSQNPEEPEEGEVKCEKCGRPMVRRTGRYGPFMGCSGFPRCKNTCKVPKDDKQ